jgi:Zn-dependent peptidase ImmA (M78 family)
VLPQLDADQLDGGGAEAAMLLRRTWRLTGRIPDMTALLESAGVFVLDFDFTRAHVDAVTVRGDNLTAVTLVRTDVSPERRRMTLAHELGHLVMDEASSLPSKDLEGRADAFAAEFLAPFADLEPELRGITPSQIDHLDGLRRYWGISLPALVKHADHGGCLTEQQYRYWFRTLNAHGLLRSRHAGTAHEPATAARILLEALRAEGYSLPELLQIARTRPGDFQRYLGGQWPWSTPPALSLVRD